MTATARTRAEDFLEVVQRGRRGGLKLYIGFAAGVGKTYRMLEEAHALASRGVDIVLGYIETHGRTDTAALVEGLETVPRHQVQYRGVTVEEMDTAAILARRPQVCIVDEIPHSNLPGSKNRKRYQDVLEILAAGINVIGALNIQHLESLKDVVEKASGVAIRETVPDSFLKEALQVVNLDLAVEDLVDRLRAGKIYAPDKVEWALEHFFHDANLLTLRELALREVAESLERQSESRARKPGQVSATRGRLMLCMSSSPPRGEILLRKASRMAGKLSGDWFVVYVETPREAPDRIDAEAQRHLLANIALARELGAEIVHLRAKDPAHALVDFARSHGVGHIMVGRSTHRRWLRRSIADRLLADAREMDVHIFTAEDT